MRVLYSLATNILSYDRRLLPEHKCYKVYADIILLSISVKKNKFECAVSRLADFVKFVVKTLGVSKLTFIFKDKFIISWSF